MAIQIKCLPCGEIQANAYIIYMDGREDCVLVDPGDEAPRLQRAVGGRKLSAILLTHAHFDHIMAAQPLSAATGAPVYIAAADAHMLNDPALNGLASLMYVEEMPAPPIAAQAYGETLSAAGMDFEVLSTPGHTKGSVCLYLRGEGLLFSGDTLFRAGFGRMDLPGGSPMDMRRSLRQLFELPPEVKVYPGHGEATTIGAEMRRYRL